MRAITSYVPFKNENGSYRTGIPKSKLRSLEKEFGLKLDSRSDYFTKMFDSLAGSKYRAEIYRDCFPITNKITSYWMRVHPSRK